MEDATKSLVEEACNGIVGKVNFIDINNTIIVGSFVLKKSTESYYKIPAGGEEIVSVFFEYGGPFADEPFEVKFDDFQLEFSTVKPGE